MKVEVFNYQVHVGRKPQPDEIMAKLNQLGELIKMTGQEVKTAVAEAVTQVKAGITTAIDKEKAEISKQIQALKDQVSAGAGIGQSDLNDILTSVASIGVSSIAAVDSISVEDGADQPANPPAEPALP